MARRELAGGPRRYAHAVAQAENQLRLTAEDYRGTRTFLRIAAGAVALAGAASLVINELRPIDDTERVTLRMMGGGLTDLGAELFGVSFIPTPMERVYDTYKKDPSIERGVRPSVGVSATGFSLRLSGAF